MCVLCCCRHVTSTMRHFIHDLTTSRSLETSGCHPHPRPAIPLRSYMMFKQRWWKASLKTVSSPTKVTRTIIPLFRTQPLMLIVGSARADVDLSHITNRLTHGMFRVCVVVLWLQEFLETLTGDVDRTAWFIVQFTNLAERVRALNHG